MKIEITLVIIFLIIFFIIMTKCLAFDGYLYEHYSYHINKIISPFWSLVYYNNEKAKANII